MRLLNVKSLEIIEFRNNKKPRYVIASHRWLGETEATFEDVRNRRYVDKEGYKKIEAFAKYIVDCVPIVEWLWIDTCCIDKTSAAELSEAVNLMFEWYKSAELCFAYLADVEAAGDKSGFEHSEWFRRGWTLQELLAPRTVLFVTKGWQVIGSKGSLPASLRVAFAVPRLEKDVARITGIPEQVLYDFKASSNLTVDERLKWIEDRSTTREEDLSYALYGIFDVAPGANYGEKHERARQRLLAAINYQGDLAMQRAERFRKIVNWLSPPDPWTNHKSARQRHEPQTGTWLLNCTEYRGWKSASLRHLWLFGKVGCGKTVLCSTAIEDVRTRCEHTANAGYAIFYLSFSDHQKQSYGDALLSWVAQLGWREPALSMLQQTYEKPNRNKPGQEELEKILLACVDTYDEVFLLIDALDECTEDGDVRHYMMECLVRLSHTAPQLRILATSRELPDVRESMVKLGAEPISIETHSVDADIRKYMATQLSRDHRLSRLDSVTRALIEDTISEKADGMFRWAFCQMQELKKLKSTRPRFVKEALFSLPVTLDETYERILVGIDERLRPDARSLLRWLAYAETPPSLGELVDATIINLGAGGSVEVDDRPGLDDALEILSGLVTIVEGREDEGDLEVIEDARGNELESGDDEVGLKSPRQQIREDTRVRLAHFSVKEYLESQRILEGSAKDFSFESFREHRILCQSCVTYITHYSKSKEKLSTEQDLITFPLLRYAAGSWFYHSALQQETKPAYELRLLCDEGVLRDWLRVHQPKQDHRLDNIGSSLYYASFVGLERLVDSVLESGADVNAQGGWYGNALQAASGRGNEKVVQILITTGAKIDAQGGRWGSALQAASWGGHEKIVRMLIDAGANVNARGGPWINALGLWGVSWGNALQAASARGREKVVQMLMDAGADVHAQGGEYGNALQAASRGGHKEVVQMLMDAGADVHAQGGEYGNALQAASRGGHKEVVQKLMDAGADVHAQGGEYGNALQAASVEGYEKVVQMLMEAGANVNAQGGHYSNALQAALWGGHKKVVQMLMDAGAGVHT